MRCARKLRAHCLHVGAWSCYMDSTLSGFEIIRRARQRGLTPFVLSTQLVNYPDYRNHEIKALFEWLGRTRRELEVFGIRGPLDGKDYAVELAPSHDLGGYQQSVGFIVIT